MTPEGFTMPTHGYVSDRLPPTWFDHLLAHCFELTISAWAMLGGLAAIFSAFNDQVAVSPSLEALPNVVAALAGVLLLSGGAGIIHGLFDSSDDLMPGFRRERMGLVLTIGGWASYGVTVAALAPAAVLSWSMCAFMVAACALRLEAIRRSEHRLRAALR